MKKRQPLTVQHDEAVAIPLNESAYYMLMTDADVEGLRTGTVSQGLQERAASMLAWKQDNEQADRESA